MRCHACDKPMHLDAYGHPVHDGPCPGYPVRWTADLATCEFCGHETPAHRMHQHRVRCTAEHPARPVSAGRAPRRCKVCSLPPWAHDVGTVCPREAPRWPLEALEAFLGPPVPEQTWLDLGVSPSNRRIWKASGFPDDVADRLACKVGIHPSLIWPDWFQAALTVMDRAKQEHRAWRHLWLEDQPNPSDQEAAA